MSAEKLKFIPGPKCKDPRVCKISCQEADVINTEVRYERDTPGSSALGYQRSISRCQNEQVLEAMRIADDVLNKD